MTDILEFSNSSPYPCEMNASYKSGNATDDVMAGNASEWTIKCLMAPPAGEYQQTAISWLVFIVIVQCTQAFRGCLTRLAWACCLAGAYDSFELIAVTVYRVNWCGSTRAGNTRYAGLFAYSLSSSPLSSFYGVPSTMHVQYSWADVSIATVSIKSFEIRHRQFGVYHARDYQSRVWPHGSNMRLIGPNMIFIRFVSVVNK